MEPSTTSRPARVLFSQHGWADTNERMLRFGGALVGDDALVVAPNLGYLRTWQRMAPLVDHVEAEAAAILATYPAAPVAVVGHSMGGLIWLEVLQRHPEWLARLAALVLIASPVGGTRLGRHLDPTGLSVGQDLHRNRRRLAERIAAAVPTLAIAGDLLLGRDGTISVASTRFAHARHVVLPRTSHPGLLQSGPVRRLTRAFLDQPRPAATDVAAVLARLQAVPGLEPTDRQGCWWAEVVLLFRDGHTVRLFSAPFGVELVYMADPRGVCLYAASAGRGHVAALRRALRALRQAHASELV